MLAIIEIIPILEIILLAILLKQLKIKGFLSISLYWILPIQTTLFKKFSAMKKESKFPKLLLLSFTAILLKTKKSF